jgi:4-hydroxybenzoyl-CoA reductase subunit beta
MMRAPKFRYHAARDVKDAVATLVIEERAMLLAGGTDIVPNMKRRQQTPGLLVDIHGIQKLRRVSNGDGLTIGACLTLTEVANHRKIRSAYRALAKAAQSVATVHLRNMGTLGGNLCLDTRCNYYNQDYSWRKSIDFCMKAPKGTDGHACQTPDGTSICWVAPSSPRCWAVSSTDTAPALVSLDAEVSLVGLEGVRRMPLLDLYGDDGMAFLTKRRDEIVTAVHLPKPSDRERSTYWKLRRRGSFDFPVLGVAATVRFSEDVPDRGPVPAGAVVVDARIVIGAVESRPVVLKEASLLVGKPLTEDLVREVAEAATKVARPLDNTDFDLAWRKKVVKSYVKEALTELRERG